LWKKANFKKSNEPLDVKVLAVATIDRIQRGDSDQFASAVTDKADFETVRKLLDDKAVCLRIVHLTATDKLEYLEWLVPDSDDFELLLNIMEDLRTLHIRERQLFTGNLQFLQFHWTCTFQKESLESTVSLQEWSILCDKLQVPLKRHVLLTMFRQEAVSTGDRLSLAQTARLLSEVEEMSLESSKRAVDGDPLDLLWNRLIETDPVPAVGISADDDDEQSMNVSMLKIKEQESTLSAVALLSFIRSQQKEYSTTMEQVADLVHILNRQQTVQDLLENKETGNTTDMGTDIATGVIDSSRLSKSRFLSFLTSDANDIVDPVKAKSGADDMTHPLSHYWINSSHDTYLASMPDSLSGQSVFFQRFKNGPELLDENMYTAALMRGVRYVEVDVWDGINKLPVVARRDPGEGSAPGLPLSMVLRVIRNFLEEHPYSFPVILKLENHCSPAIQLKMAKDIYFDLQADDFIASAGKNVDFTGAILPSPVTMMGKVVLMGKVGKFKEGAKILRDDFDDENDIWQVDAVTSNFWNDDDEAFLENDASRQGIIVGFDAKGPLRSKDIDALVRSPKEMLESADEEATVANKAEAEKVKLAAKLKYELETQEALAAELTRRAGMTSEEVRWRATRDAASGREFDTELDTTSVEAEYTYDEKSPKDEGLEVQEFLPDVVEGSRDRYAEAAQDAMESSQKVSVAAAKLTKAEDALKRTESDLEMSKQRERELAEEARRAAVEARSHREHAEVARARVDTVRELLLSSEKNASTSGTVVVTATTEAKISEKRAGEAEARASRALAIAQKDRARADNETGKEEDLEQKVSNLHGKYTEALDAAAEARDRVEKAASMLDRVNEQIKLIEGSSQFRKELQDRAYYDDDSSSPRHGGTFFAKHAAKLEERETCRELIKEASEQNALAEMQLRSIQDAFEVRVHALKKQADLAALARKQADRSSHHAEDLAEHAEEERDAATLRHIAREKAESTVDNRDSHRESALAQLAQAERSSTEAASIAVASRKRADRLAHEAEKIKDHRGFLQAHEEKQWERNKARGEYDAAKLEKDRKDAVAIQEKRRLDTDSEVYKSAVRDVAAETDRVKVERLYDEEAIVAYNRALQLKNEARLALESSKANAHIAKQKSDAAKHAREYKEKSDMMCEIPLALSRITMLHTLKHRSWDKSLSLPSAHVHSFAQNVLLHMVEENHMQHLNTMHAFTRKHLCRVFPSWFVLQSKNFTNYDPVLAWTMGCQIVSMNLQSTDESLLVADGRFRQNGSCGYVLKPPHMLDSSSKKEESQHWKFNVLSGFKLLKPSGGRKQSSVVNPFIRLSLYEGSSKAKRIMYNTKRVKQNGLNPIWKEDEVFEFTISNPSVAMLVFSVWDKTDDGTEDFIAAASLPVSCIREGYRSVALFDAKHTRSGPYAFSSLLIKAAKRPAPLK
jgi:hypothetical protein